MKIGRVKWKKGETVMEVDMAICECGGGMKYITSITDYRNDDYCDSETLYQCEICKNIGVESRSLRDSEELIKHGWEQVKE